MRIDPGSIPPEGILIQGEEDTDIFDLGEEDIRALSPLRYRFQASLQEDAILLQGAIQAGFELRCVRCLEFFTKTIRLDPYTLLHPLEIQGTQDLTDRLREDILLDLPGHPRCEMGDSPRECPALGSFGPESEDKKSRSSESESDSDSDSDSEAADNVWQALNKLDPKSEQKSGDR